jgi:hypothetical protein
MLLTITFSSAIQRECIVFLLQQQLFREPATMPVSFKQLQRMKKEGWQTPSYGAQGISRVFTSISHDSNLVQNT